jgi:hypothetical protein
VWFGRARGSIAFSLIFLHPFFIKKKKDVAEGKSQSRQGLKYACGCFKEFQLK